MENWSRQSKKWYSIEKQMVQTQKAQKRHKNIWLTSDNTHKWLTKAKLQTYSMDQNNHDNDF